MLILIFIRKGRLAIIAPTIFAYYWFLVRFWPDTSQEVSSGMTARVGVCLGIGVVVGFIIIYLLVVKGD
jgi:hypothetical protein